MNSVKVRKECKGEGPWKELKLQREVIAFQGAHHQGSTILLSLDTDKMNKKKTLFK